MAYNFLNLVPTKKYIDCTNPRIIIKSKKEIQRASPIL